MNDNELKSCPYCKEEVRVEAVKCPFCGERLKPPTRAGAKTPAVEPQPPPSPSSMSTAPQETPLPDWPASWPGQDVVDLDNLGDPGAWLEDQMPDIEPALRGDGSEVEGMAAGLADGYITTAWAMGLPLPSDFDISDDEWRRMVEAD